MVGKQKLVDVEWRSSGTYLAACFERNLNDFWVKELLY